MDGTCRILHPWKPRLGCFSLGAQHDTETRQGPGWECSSGQGLGRRWQQDKVHIWVRYDKTEHSRYSLPRPYNQRFALSRCLLTICTSNLSSRVADGWIKLQGNLTPWRLLHFWSEKPVAVLADGAHQARRHRRKPARNVVLYTRGPGKLCSSVVWRVDPNQRSKPNVLLVRWCRDVGRAVGVREASQGLRGGSVPWRRSASMCWGGHSGSLGSGNVRLLQRKKNCEVSAKEKIKEARVLWLTINECHNSFQSRGLLIFFCCLIQLCSKGHT